MFWKINHMVASKEKALKCMDCHDSGGRFDWQKLGYEGDPITRGGREQTGLVQRRQK